MKELTMDTAIKFGAGRYRQEPGLLCVCGAEIARFSRRPFILAGHRAFVAVKKKLIPALEAEKLEYTIELFGGECCYEAAVELADKCRAAGCDEVIGVGGGKVMDLAKAVGEYAKLGVINIPTSIATCAAFTTMSVMYTPDGKSLGNWRFAHEVDAVLVDTEVIAACPSRYAAAGILDAMAKRIEIQNGKPVMRLEDTTFDLYTAFRMAEYTYDVLGKLAPQAIEDIKQSKVTKTVEDVTFLSIAVTGVLANITRSYNQSALAHLVYYAARTFFTAEAHAALHGEIVAVGLFLQLYYNRLPQQTERLRELMQALGMPLTLRELGIEPTEANLNIFEGYLCSSQYVEDNEQSHSLLHDAVRQMI